MNVRERINDKIDEMKSEDAPPEEDKPIDYDVFWKQVFSSADFIEIRKDVPTITQEEQAKMDEALEKYGSFVM